MNRAIANRMGSPRLWMGLALVSGMSGLFILFPTPASAAVVVCTADSPGTLTFVDSQEGVSSKTTLKLTNDDTTVVLVFTVAGCELRDASAIQVNESSSDISQEKLPETFASAVIQPKGTFLMVSVPVKKDAVDAGEHHAIVGVTGGPIETSLQAITLERKYDSPLIYVILAGAIALGVAWCGLVLFVTAASGGRRVGIRLPWIGLAVPAAAAAAYAVFQQSYGGSDTWALKADTFLALFFGCAAAAAGGTTTGALGKAITIKRKGR